MATDPRMILSLDVPLIVEIGRRGMAMEDVLALQPGAILELDKNADDRLEVLINNKVIGQGEAVKVGEN
ncbi:MAG: FliM/FliN family flagellar motor switch protein, partial [Planctomycetota bacterium]